jgi:hypothetical protein
MASESGCNLLFSAENIINSYQNEPVLWNSELNASEGDKEVAWCRISSLFGMPTAGSDCLSLIMNVILM